MNEISRLENVTYHARDTNYELWFRDEYFNLVRERKLTTAVRPGNRTHPNPKGVNKNETVVVKVIKKPGDEEMGINPEFHEFNTLARIVDLEVKKIRNVTDNDLKNSSLDCLTKEEMKNHLKKIYLRDFKDDELVTLLKIEYI